MKTQFKYAMAIVLLALGFVSNAQKGTGLIFNEAEYEKIPTRPSDGSVGGKGIENYDQSKDLSKTYPITIIDQGSALSCVAWTTAVYAYPLQRAMQNNITDAETIKKMALSAMYPYKMIRKMDCDTGLKIHQVAEFMQTQGNLLLSDLPTNNCNVQITNEMKARAARFLPIKGYQKLFDATAKPIARWQTVLAEIGKYNRPVIVAMQVWRNNFNLLKDTDDYYRPARGGSERMQHAMTVVGYDMYKRAFKIANTWGTTFGKNGYFWMKFDDFGENVQGAIILNLPDQAPQLNSNSSNKSIEVGGKFGFLYLNQDTEKFEQKEPFHIKNGLYEMNKRNWQVGQFFQLITDNARNAQSVCVFSIDAKNKFTLHWPIAEVEKMDDLAGAGVTDQMPSKNFKITIPGEDKALMIEEAGTDYLCVLYSDNSLIQEIPQIKRILETSKEKDIITRIQKALGDRLINPANVKYQSSGMSFTASSTQGDTVPLILKIESVN